MVYRVDHGEQLPGATAVTQSGEGHHGPNCGMGVLPAILSYTRDITFYVARIQARFVERRIEELDQRILSAHESPIHRLHSHARALLIAGAGKNRPALRDRINLTFGVTRRPKQRAIVEMSPGVPMAIPAILLDVLL